MEKARLIRGPQVAQRQMDEEQVQADETQRRMRGHFRQQGGNDDLIEE